MRLLGSNNAVKTLSHNTASNPLSLKNIIKLNSKSKHIKQQNLGTQLTNNENKLYNESEPTKQYTKSKNK